jgi:hypothetical protein
LTLASGALNETKRVNNGSTATEDSPPAKKNRTCPKPEVEKEPVAGGKGHKQGRVITREDMGMRVSGRGGSDTFLSTYFFLPWQYN